MKKNNNIKKDFFWNTIGTMLNSFISLFLLIIVTRVNGVDAAGIFTYGFSIACLLFYIGIYNGRIFQVTENDKVSNKTFIITKIITCLVMIIFSIFYVIIKKYSSEKAIIILLLCILKAAEAFSEVLYGIFQKYNYLYKSGFSLTIKNLIGIICFLLIDLLTHNIILSIISIIITYILIFFIYDLNNLKKHIKDSEIVNKKDIKNIFRKGFYPFAISFLSLFVINTPKYAIDSLLNDDLQAFFGIIVMPATVVSLAAQFIIYPFLNMIKEVIESKKVQELQKITKKFIFVIFIIGMLGTICAYLIGIPILEFVYGVKLLPYRVGLVIIMIGATFNAEVYTLSSILISFRNMRLQTLAYFIIAIISYLISYSLVKELGINGAFYSYSIIMLILFILYCGIMNIGLKKLRSDK